MNARIRRSAVLSVALLAAVITGVTAAGAAQAAATSSDGYVRLAHLSPDTPAVDVYLSAVSGDMKEQTFPAVDYGVVSQYMPLPAGTYTVAMRTAGSPETDPPVLTTSVT